MASLRKAAKGDLSGPSRKAMRATTTSNATGAELTKSSGVHILPQIAPDTEDEITEFNICYVEVLSDLYLVIPAQGLGRWGR